MRIGYVDGDGIGPEIMAVGRDVLAATGIPIDWVRLEAGAAAFRAHGSALPDTTLDAMGTVDAILKGPMEVPMDGYPSPNQGLRAAAGAFANVRTVQYLPHPRSRYPDLDVGIVRGVTEDLTAGTSQRFADGAAGVATKVVSRPHVERLARFAYAHALERGIERVTITHLAPSQRDTDGLFLEVALEVAADYPDLRVDEEAIDPLCVHLIQDPTPYRLLLTSNLYGGILCGVLAGLAGSVGLMPGGNLGGTVPIFEAGHGSSPRHAGKDRANPVGVIHSGAMLLEHLGQREAADRVRGAVYRTMSEGHATPDVGGRDGTRQFGARVAERCAVA